MQAAGDTIRIIFRGVRGSHPMPGPSTLRYGGNTTCHEIRVGGRLIIFDAGTGIISLGNELMRDPSPRSMALFFSHNHHDHIGGLLYFKPAYSSESTVSIYGPAGDPGDILQALEAISSPAAHPVQFARMGMRCTTQIVATGSVVVWTPGEETPRLLTENETPGAEDVVVRVLKNVLHPMEGTLNFRLEYKGKSYVYATDVEGDEKRGDPALAEFARGAQLMAHDGQYTSEEYERCRKGWGHSTIAMAVRTAEMAGVERLAIIHHDPNSTDELLDSMDREARKRHPFLFIAKEGQEIVL